MKKSDKPILIQAFDQFCAMNNYCIESSHFNGQLYLKPIIKATDRTLDYQKEQFLFKDKLNQFQYKEKALDFAQFIFEHEEYKHLGLRFLIEKTPNAESRDYYDIVPKIIDILKDQGNDFFDYISRPVYIKNNRSEMINLFKEGLLSQPECEAIIEVYLQLDSFNKLANKAVIYDMVEKYIDNREKYQEYFIDLNEAQEKIDTQNIISQNHKCEMYSTLIDINSLIKMSPTTNERELITALNALEELSVFYEKMGVEKVITGKPKNIENSDGKTVEINWLSQKIDDHFINYFMNTYLKELLVNPLLRKAMYVQIDSEFDNMVKSFVQDCINSARAQVLQDKIETMVPTNTHKNALPKKKI